MIGVTSAYLHLDGKEAEDAEKFKIAVTIGDRV